MQEFRKVLVEVESDFLESVDFSVIILKINIFEHFPANFCQYPKVLHKPSQLNSYNKLE